ncbi:MAG: NAD(+) synthase [Promethearchaeota archaeon]
MIKELEINPQKEIEKIKKFIKQKMEELDREGAIIALSGGLDSAVTAKLAVDAIGSDLVKLYYLPERDSKKIHKKHAKAFAKYLNCKLYKKSITMILLFLGSYSKLPLIYIPTKRLRQKGVEYGRKNYISEKEEDFLVTRLKARGGSWFARANAYSMAKHRIRMVKIYMEAEAQNLMVIGAANKTELLTGTFSKWGVDHCADIMPVIHLFRSQLEIIAKHLNIPDYILNKAADPDIIPSLHDKGDLLGSFAVADEILYHIQKGIDKEELLNKYDPNLVNHLYLLWTYSKHMRESPYHL